MPEQPDEPLFPVAPDENDPMWRRFSEVAPYFGVVAWNAIQPRLQQGTPIERLFMLGLLVRCHWHFFDYGVQEGATKLASLETAAEIASINPRRPLAIFPQHPVDKFRADILLAWARRVGDPSSVMFLGVECDGHDFHERTKAQAQHDKSRDRAFLRMGVPVMRFTGSELTRYPVACGAEALSGFIDERKRVDDEFMLNHAKNLK